MSPRLTENLRAAWRAPLFFYLDRHSDLFSEVHEGTIEGIIGVELMG